MVEQIFFLPQEKRSVINIDKLEKQKLNFPGSGLFHMKTRVFHKYFANDCKSVYSNCFQ